MITLSPGAHVISKRAKKIWIIVSISAGVITIKSGSKEKEIPYSRFNYGWEVFKNPDH